MKMKLKIRRTNLNMLVNRGYETLEEVCSLITDIENNPAPYVTVDVEDDINWVEFCRALPVRDFAEGDEFSLNNVSFIVKGVYK